MNNNNNNYNNENALIIFTRVLVPGKTKTRMMPFLTMDQCQNLHSSFIKDTLTEAFNVNANIFIFYTPGDDLLYLKEIINEVNNKEVTLEYVPQEGSDIGLRMENAFIFVFSKGFKRISLIGTDIPEITCNIIEKSFLDLENNDLTINPTLDGGYYLIGMNKNHKEIWNIESYGLNTVIEDTIYKIKQLNLSYTVGDILQDMDTKNDLLDLYKRIRIVYCKDSRILNTRNYIINNLKSKLDELL